MTSLNLESVECSSSETGLFRSPDGLRGPQRPRFRRESEFLQQIFDGSGGPEALHSDHLSVGTDISVPAQRGGLLHRNARLHRRAETPGPCIPRSCFSKSSHEGMLTTRAFTPSAGQLLVAATHKETSLPVPIRITSGFPPAASARMYAPLLRPPRGIFRAVERRHRLPRQHQHCRFMLKLHDALLHASYHFIRVARAATEQSPGTARKPASCSTG